MTMNIPMEFLFIFILINFFTKCNTTCYFPTELKGEYLTQSTIQNNHVKYSHVNITDESIPIWGRCYKRINDNVILMIGTDETTCYRCFHIKLLSRNILQVKTDENYIAKCYTNVDKAIKSCPIVTTGINTNQYNHNNNNNVINTEIILYKYREADGHDIRREFCPINGRFKFTYNLINNYNDLTGSSSSGSGSYSYNNTTQCNEKISELDSCPSGTAMNLRFRQCTFDNYEITLECLGHWRGDNNQEYLALYNTKIDDKHGPKYRCALIQYNNNNYNNDNEIIIALSNDSTCTSINNYNYNGILKLYEIKQDIWSEHNHFCSYPKQLYGKWEHIYINKTLLKFNDPSSYKTYNMKCLENINNERFIVYSRTQCDEEMYHCIWIKERNINIFEFQIGAKISKNFSTTLCEDKYFDNNRWLTQGRYDNEIILSPCPINGKFTGLIPDELNLCTKLSSECDHRNIMYYQVSSCDDNEIYEEREYHCLGQWEENKLIYTYTKRYDIGIYECFVGTIINDKQIFIKEAGEHCQREIDPYRYGMELNKIMSCNTITLINNHTINDYNNTGIYNINNITTDYNYNNNNDIRMSSTIKIPINNTIYSTSIPLTTPYKTIIPSTNLFNNNNNNNIDTTTASATVLSGSESISDTSINNNNNNNNNHNKKLTTINYPTTTTNNLNNKNSTTNTNKNNQSSSSSSIIINNQQLLLLLIIYLFNFI